MATQPGPVPTLPIRRAPGPPRTGTIADRPRIQDTSMGLPALMPEPEPAPPLPETGFGENVAAGAEQAWETLGFAEVRRESEGYDQIVEALNARGGQRFYNPMIMRLRNEISPWGDPLGPYAGIVGALGGHGDEVTGIDAIWAEIGRIRQSEPGYLAEFGNSHAEFAAKMRERGEANYQRAAEVRSRATALGSIGGFVGDVGGTFVDPLNVATLTMPTGGISILGRMAYAGAANTGVTMAQAPWTDRNFARIGVDLSVDDHLLMGGTSFAGGSVITGGTIVLGRGLGKGYDISVAQLYRSLPESVQQRWGALLHSRGIDVDGNERVVPLGEVIDDHFAARRPLTVSQVLDRLGPMEAARFARDAIGPLPTPDELAAIRVLEREGEIYGTSPFAPGPEGDAAHRAGLAAASRALIEADPYSRLPNEMNAILELHAAAAAARARPPDAGDGLPAAGGARRGSTRYVDTFSQYNQNAPGQRPGAPRSYRGGTHVMNGRDYGMPVNTPIRAEMDWEVVASPRRRDRGMRQNEDGHGKWFAIRYADGSIHIFRHVNTFPRAQSGRAGETIALSGNTGIRSSGPHTHREAWVLGDGGRLTGIDPAEWQRRASRGEVRAAPGGGSRGTAAPAAASGVPDYGFADARAFATRDRAIVANVIGGAEGGAYDRWNTAGADVHGRYQIWRPTWVSTYRRINPGASEAQALAARRDPASQDRVMNQLLAGYEVKLRENGLPVTAENMYALHWFGESGGISALKNPNQPITNITRALERNGLTADMTAGQAVARGNERIRQAIAAAGGEMPGSAPASRAGLGEDDGAAARAEIDRLYEAAVGARAPPAVDAGTGRARLDGGDFAPPPIRADLAAELERRVAEIERLADAGGVPTPARPDADGGSRNDVDVYRLADEFGAPSLADFAAAELGTRQWVVAPRLTARMKEKGYELAVPPARWNALKQEWADEVWRRVAEERMAGPASGAAGAPRSGEVEAGGGVQARQGEGVPAPSSPPARPIGLGDAQAAAAARELGMKPLVEYVGERLGTTRWRAARNLTPAMRRQGVERAVTPAELRQMEQDWADGVWARSAEEAGLGRAGFDARIDEAELRAFDDIDGTGLKTLADSLEHDFRAAVDARTAGEEAEARFRIGEEGEEVTARQLLDEVKAEGAAAAALRACL